MYIDYRAMARDMEYGGDLFTLENDFEQLHVSWNR
ncbi:antirestriction protein [Pseudomonas sp. TCU-HL1]|nr:antirestriction protein [Pseudomonas sp. TCU-HL1]